jgi:5'-phosphate synthase pdxT subunit
MSLKIAVLALQGDFEKHILRVHDIGEEAIAARTARDIESSDAIILPGGESTTISKLMARYGINTAIKSAAKSGKPIFGTCAGMILMAKDIVSESAEKGGQSTLGLMDITVNRNAYGRQIESFETTLLVTKLILDSKPAPSLEAVFIRAPSITKWEKGVNILAEFDGAPVLVEQDNFLAASFHPEMTQDLSVHQYFLNKVKNYLAAK